MSISPSSSWSNGTHEALRTIGEIGLPLKFPLQICIPRVTPSTPSKHPATIADRSLGLIRPSLRIIPKNGTSS